MLLEKILCSHTRLTLEKVQAYQELQQIRNPTNELFGEGGIPARAEIRAYFDGEETDPSSYHSL